MKEYPSISRSFAEIPNAYCFDKNDGSNIRINWVKKRGWSLFGCRHRLFDETDQQFKDVIPLFHQTLADELAKVATDMRWERMIVFAEYWGANSLAGVRVTDEPMNLTLFDVNPYKQGILGPKAFQKIFGENDKIPTAKFLGINNWTRGFVDRVWDNDVKGITFEGVVGKGGEGHSLQMRKAKTKAWIDAIHARYPKEEADKITNS